MHISFVQIIFLTLIFVIVTAIYLILLRYGKRISKLDQQLSFRSFSSAVTIWYSAALGFAFLSFVNIEDFIPASKEIKFFLTLGVTVIGVLAIGYIVDFILYFYYLKNWEKRTPPDYGLIDQDSYYNKQKKKNQVFFIAILYIIDFIIIKGDLDFTLFTSNISGEIVAVQLSHVVNAFIIITTARLIAWFITNISLQTLYQKKEFEEGSQFAINQLIKYVIFVVAAFMALDQVVTDMKVIYGAGAALLVGIGLGLQQTFNDFFSGLVILFERSVMVGDILEMDGQVGRVLKIGLRASRIETRNSVSMLVPNSKLVNESVINWTHFDNIVRFQIDIGVAYGSDTTLVKNLLLESTKTNPHILTEPAPFVRLNDFGDNALSMTLYFFSTYVMRAEDVKSGVRFEIDNLFRANNVTIPFPQRDVWIRQSHSKS